LLDNGFRYSVSEKNIVAYIAQKTDAVRLSVGKRVIHEFSLTQKQYDVVKAVIDVITNKK